MKRPDDTNLLQETLKIMRENEVFESDVDWVGSKDYWFSWGDFKKLADIEYDNGFGAPEIAIDLKIVGDKWWLERHEYDRSEWWEFKRMPMQPDEHHVPEKLHVGQWTTLKDMNDGT
jgi:hypothetical protein